MLRVFRFSPNDCISFEDPRLRYITVSSAKNIQDEFSNNTQECYPSTKLALYSENYVVLHHGIIVLKTILNDSQRIIGEEELKKVLYGYYEPADQDVFAFYQTSEELNHLRSIATTHRVIYQQFDDQNIDLIRVEVDGQTEHHPVACFYNIHSKYGFYYYMWNGKVYMGSIANVLKVFPVDKIEPPPNSGYDIAKLYSFRDNIITNLHQVDLRNFSKYLNIQISD